MSKCEHGYDPDDCGSCAESEIFSDTVDADHIINLISDTLAEADGEYIARVANQLLSADVRYIEDSLFDIKWKV